MAASDLRKQSSEQLQEVLEQELRCLFNLRMQRGSGQQPKNSEFSRARRNIARIKTLLHERKQETSDG